MKVLVACEFSGIVRDAFKAKGHDAWSCDLLDTEKPGQHMKGDVLKVLRQTYHHWDLIIAHPPCTYLTSAGARWWKNRQKEQKDAIRFVKCLWAFGTKKMALENPIGKLSTAWYKPTQIIQPWQFGHGETKATCLWLKGLHPLVPSKIVEGREARIHKEPPSKDRWKNRSRTYQGIADAMAEQWGGDTYKWCGKVDLCELHRS